MWFLTVLSNSTDKFRYQASFFQSRLLGKIKAHFPPNEFEGIIHVFITSRLDFCNSSHFGVDQSSLRHLQLVQNSYIHLLTWKWRRDHHITPVLASFHWLPVSFRMQFKIFKALNGVSSSYLTGLLHQHALARALRSADQMLLDTLRSRLNQRWKSLCSGCP